VIGMRARREPGMSRVGCRDLVVAVLATACVAWAVSDARASCGDWLEGHENNGHQSNAWQAADHGATDHGATDQAAATARTEREAAPRARPSRGPCRGPSCSKRPPTAPLAPSEPPHESAGERWCQLVESPAPMSVSRFAVAMGDEPAPLSACSGRLDRPPRDVAPGRS
jgi:hypothetical protein